MAFPEWLESAVKAFARSDAAHRFAPVEVTDTARVEAVALKRIQKLPVAFADHAPHRRIIGADAACERRIVHMGMYVAKIGEIVRKKPLVPHWYDEVRWNRKFHLFNIAKPEMIERLHNMNEAAFAIIGFVMENIAIRQ